MSTENAAPNFETASRKQTRTNWVALGCNLILFACVLFLAARQSGPWNGTNLEGTVAILDEKGVPIPWREVDLTFFSHYPSGYFWSDLNRKRNLYVGKSEFGNRIPIKIPKYASTLFFHTKDKKYAAVVDLGPNDPTTGLVVELHPRHSATGRLVDQKGAPLAGYEFSLQFSRTPDFGFDKSATVETFEYEYCVTDSDGVFKADRLIPGLEYKIRIHIPSVSMYGASVTMPILKPEQYEEPYSFGDVSVRLSP